MVKILVIPENFREAATAAKISPSILSGDFLFLTGTTGSGLDGSMPDDPVVQFRSAFDKINTVLNEANLIMQSVVEMTSYHVGLRDHFEIFDKVRLEYFDEPYPAWTAVEVAGLRREGALVEIRIIASLIDKKRNKLREISSSQRHPAT